MRRSFLLTPETGCTLLLICSTLKMTHYPIFADALQRLQKFNQVSLI
jgi:hypothetical protein